MTKRVMVDIETLGTDPGAAIVSIGATTFGTENRDTLYRPVAISSATDAGLTVDGGTLEWWLEQDGNARAELAGGLPLRKALADLNDFVTDADEVWANSPSFDLAILSAAMETVGLAPEWDYYQERDFRTLKNLPGKPEIPNDNAHHALADAEHQADVAERMLERYEEQVRMEAPGDD